MEEENGVNFASFLMSLATQALMQMGKMPAPAGVDLPIDKNAAKQTIDLISMLEQKTKGNLDAEEQKLLEELLHNLRMTYVVG